MAGRGPGGPEEEDRVMSSDVARPAGVVKRTRRPCRQAATARPVASIVLPVLDSPMRITDSRSSIRPPSASAAITVGDTLGVVLVTEGLRAPSDGKARVDEPSALSALGPLGDLGLEQGGAARFAGRCGAARRRHRRVPA
jgi:hypothetical protein